MQSVSSCCALAVVTVAIVPPPKIFAKIAKSRSSAFSFHWMRTQKGSSSLLKHFDKPSVRPLLHRDGTTVGGAKTKRLWSHGRPCSCRQCLLKYPKTHCSPLPPVVT